MLLLASTVGGGFISNSTDSETAAVTPDRQCLGPEGGPHISGTSPAAAQPGSRTGEDEEKLLLVVPLRREPQTPKVAGHRTPRC